MGPLQGVRVVEFAEIFAFRTRAEWWSVFEADGRVQPDVAPGFSVTPGAVGRVPAVEQHDEEIRAELGR